MPVVGSRNDSQGGCCLNSCLFTSNQVNVLYFSSVYFCLREVLRCSISIEDTIARFRDLMFTLLVGIYSFISLITFSWRNCLFLIEHLYDAAFILGICCIS
jgi:hypothetical protein